MWHCRVINLRPLWRFYLKVNYTAEFFNTLPYSLLKQVYWTLHKLFKRFECYKRGYSHHFVNWSIIFTFTNVTKVIKQTKIESQYPCAILLLYITAHKKALVITDWRDMFNNTVVHVAVAFFWRNRLLFRVRKHWYRLNTKYFLSEFEFWTKTVIWNNR